MRHQLANASQMLGELESFYYNRNVHNVSRYENPKRFPCSSFNIVY